MYVHWWPGNREEAHHRAAGIRSEVQCATIGRDAVAVARRLGVRLHHLDRTWNGVGRGKLKLFKLLPLPHSPDDHPLQDGNNLSLTSGRYIRPTAGESDSCQVLKDQDVAFGADASHEYTCSRRST